MASWNETQKQSFIALWVMTLLLGAYTIIFAASLYALLSRRFGTRSHLYLVPVTVVLYIVAAAQVFIQFALLLTTAFAPGANSGALDLDARILNTNNLLETTTSFLTVINNLIADGLLIWRCYNVMGRRWTIISCPSLILLAGTVAGFTSSGLLAKLYLMTKDLNPDVAVLPPAATAVFHQQEIMDAIFYGCTFAGNAVVTVLIACKIWSTTKRLRNSALPIDTRPYTRIIALIVESSLMHSCCLLFAVLFTLHLRTVEAGRYVITMAAAGISAGAGPTLIIFMLAIGKTIEDETGGAGSKLVFLRPSPVIDLLRSTSGRSHTLKGSRELDDFRSPYSYKWDRSDV